MIRKAIAVLFIVLFGALKLPLEATLDREQTALGLRKAALDINLNLFEHVSQMGFIATLSGLRSPVAAVLWIELTTAWERTEWSRMEGLINTITTLQPRSEFYWDLASWQMAYNASTFASRDPKQPNEALRLLKEQGYIKLGRDILKNGVRNNPDSVFLLERLGVLLRDKLNDHCGAGEAFLRASELPDCPAYLPRFAGYELSQCPGKEREAYDLLRKLYEKGSDERKPTLLKTLKELEKKLDVAPQQQISSGPQ